MTLALTAGTAVENSLATTVASLTTPNNVLAVVWLFQDTGTGGSTWNVTSTGGLTWTQVANNQGFMQVWVASVTTGGTFTISITTSAGAVVKRVMPGYIADSVGTIPGTGNNSIFPGPSTATTLNLNSTAIGSIMTLSGLVNGASAAVAGETRLDTHGGASFNSFPEDTALWQVNAQTTSVGQVVTLSANTGCWDLLAVEFTPTALPPVPSTPVIATPGSIAPKERTAHMRYLFGSIRTGQILYEIPLSSVSLTKKLSDTGELRGTFYMDSSGFDNFLLKNACAPGLTFIVAERDDVPIWGGMVWSRTYQSQAKVVQIYAKSYEAYPGCRFMPDFNMTADQVAIFLQLWTQMQQDAGSNMGVVVPNISNVPIGTHVTQTVTTAATDYTAYRQIMDQLANGDQGFDWTIDWARAGSTYTKTLRLQQPFLGATNTIDPVVFDYPGNILNYWETDSLTDSGTNIYLMGVGQGDGMIISTQNRQDLIDSGYVRIDVSLQAKDTTDQNVLNQLAVRQQQLAATPINTFVIQQKADKDPVFGSYSLGDYVLVSVQDAWNTVLFEETRRVVGLQYTPSQAGSTEEVELTLEGIQASA